KLAEGTLMDHELFGGTTSLLSRAWDRPLLGTTDDRESVSEPLEVTAVSHIHGTRRIHEVTGGHEEDPIRVQEEPRGHHRTREDTPLRRFGTVRLRVQSRAPDHFFLSLVPMGSPPPGSFRRRFKQT